MTPLNLTVISPGQTQVGSTFQVTVQASNAHDLFGVPLQMQFDPKVLALVNVDAGELLGRDGQAVALTHRDDGQGAVSMNLERPPQTKGVDGQGPLCVLTFKAIAPGNSQLALVRVGARDSRQQNLPALGQPGERSGDGPAVRRTTEAVMTRACYAQTNRSAQIQSSRRASAPVEAGVTLIELIIVIAILSILATAALPVARFEVKRRKERELRRDLWEMRAAIDAYKDAADKGGIQTKADSNNYPPDLQTLVDGVDIQNHKVRFLRAIPVDPMTNSTDWGLRSNQDDPDSRQLRRTERLRCLHQEPGNGAGRNEVRHMVNAATSRSRSRCRAAEQRAGLHADRADHRDGDHRHSRGHRRAEVYRSSCGTPRRRRCAKTCTRMRQAIDSYTVDKEKAPQSLDDLVQSGYLKAIPVDPMTGRDDTWMPDTSDTLMDVDETAGGINNVHSGAQGLATDGSSYNTVVIQVNSELNDLVAASRLTFESALPYSLSATHYSLPPKPQNRKPVYNGTRVLCLKGRASGLREFAMRVPLLLAFAGLSSTLVFAQQPTPSQPPAGRAFRLCRRRPHRPADLPARRRLPARCRRLRPARPPARRT